LREFRVRGVSTNIPFLLNVMRHPAFLAGQCDTKFIEENPILFSWKELRDRASKLLNFLADVTINGNPIVGEGLKAPEHVKPAVAPVWSTASATTDSSEPAPPKIPSGTKQILDERGAKGLAQWILQQKRLLVTDTTFRDAHQSLLATRMR